MKFFIILLAIGLGPGTHYEAAQGQLVHTFNSRNGYLQYYTWAANTHGRIELRFKTSQVNATLIYTAGNDNLVHVALQNGRIALWAKLSNEKEDTGPLMQDTGPHLFNDDQWHYLILIHNKHIITKIDGKVEVYFWIRNSNYYRLYNVTPLYIGGIPLSVKPSPSGLIGCIKDVYIRDNSDSEPYSRSYAVPVFQNNTNAGPGCVEPCVNETCSEGETCINDWSNGVGLCSCTSLHVTCLKSITKGPVSLDGTNYRCYDTYSYFEPPISSYLVLRLRPPYSTDGILLTFHGFDSHVQRSASLYVKDSLLHFAVYSQDTSIVSLLKFNDVPIIATYYQIALLRNEVTANITLIPQTLGSPETRFTNEFTKSSRERICLGRGTSELRPYAGSVEMLQEGLQVYQYLKDLSLNVSPFRYLPGNGSNYLSLWPNSLSKYKTLSFRLWMRRPGTLIYLSRAGHVLDIQLEEGRIIIDNGSVTHQCSGRSIRNDVWIFLSLSRPQSSKLLVTVDELECIINDDNLWGETIQTMASAPIVIGKTFSGYIEGISADNMRPICPVIHP